MIIMHTELCKQMSHRLGLRSREVDPSGECRNLDVAIRSLGRTWHDYQLVDLIDVVETHTMDCTHDGGYMWHLLQKEPTAPLD